MSNAAQKRKLFLDPCHSKCVNISNLQLSRMKLKMKLELRVLKKVTEDVIQEGDNSVIVVPASVYENPLDTVPYQNHEGIQGCFGSVTEEQLKGFFGETIPATITSASIKDNSGTVEAEVITPDEPTITSPDKSLDINPVSCPDDDLELQNAIWNITSDFNLENDNRAIPNEQVSYKDYLMEHSGDENHGVLFDLS